MESIREILSATKVGKMGKAGEEQSVRGWVKTKRLSPNVFFIALSDGSTPTHLQITGAPRDFEALLEKIHTGACLKVRGTLVASPGQGQSYELVAKTIELIGFCDASSYPIQPKKHSLAFLRSLPHLRVRTQLFGAIFRIRHLMSQAFHQFFSDRGFFYVHTPVITPSDCEGAGALFSVRHEGRQKEFFEEKAYLTVSGQLEAECLAMGLSKVYTFAPTFRAENSHTTRHLSEFWMIEPEMAFCDLKGNVEVARRAIQYTIGRVLKEAKEDLVLLGERQHREDAQRKAAERRPPLLEQLHLVAEEPWQEIDYSEAYDILKASKKNQKGRFEYPIEQWGQALQTEHERYLVEQHFGKAVVVTNYPKAIKAFYMRTNDDEKTVAAMDILLPEVGEIVGGSQREERLDYLLENMRQQGIPHEKMAWYLDSRKYGGCPHAGFGIGFDRMVLFVTGMENIRDTIPFPRTPGRLTL